MGNRRRGREHVLKALYAFELGDQTREEVIDTILLNGGLDEATLEFSKKLFIKTIDSLEHIDGRIEQLATNWKIDRIAIVDKNILRMAICEVDFMPDIPIKVAINEAIELAKKYSTLESASFVNGILDHVLQSNA
ncbi:MAG: transcription antitermination factor NusB [Candidatus Zixiibacteriota bacterium]